MHGVSLVPGIEESPLHALVQGGPWRMRVAPLIAAGKTAITYTRGVVTVLDRAGLEAACPCCQVNRNVYGQDARVVRR